MWEEVGAWERTAVKEVCAALSTLVRVPWVYMWWVFSLFSCVFPYIKLANYLSGSSQVLRSGPTLVTLQLTLTSVVKNSCNKMCVLYFAGLILCTRRWPGPLQSLSNVTLQWLKCRQLSQLVERWKDCQDDKVFLIKKIAKWLWPRKKKKLVPSF